MVEEIESDYQIPVILCGDLNSAPDSAVMSLLYYN
jgi:endonuclease/exonuclease/phosphatase family metal-dependent hydrolase